MTAPFYRAFEDRHRGSRALILGRLNIYVPFISPLKRLYGERPALDLGCGRGEWLEVLLQNDFLPTGIDLDEGMLEGCKALSLPAIQGDALDILKSLPDESQVVVSGFHIAEHIPFGNLKELVAQAFRVLKPAGLLILETPNSENIVVGTQSFYLDPTHERPIPHLLLSFLTEYSGFCRSKLLRLQESKEIATASSTALMSVLGAVSPDYAIVAQKSALSVDLEHFDEVFQQDYGLALEVLAHRYDAEAQWRHNQLQGRTDELGEQLGAVTQKIEEVARQNTLLEEAVRDLCGRNASSDSKLSALVINSTEVSRQFQETVSHASEAEARLHAAQQMNDMLQEQLKTASNQAVVLQTQVSILNGTASEQAAQTQRLEFELTELEAEYQKVALEQLAPKEVELARLMRLLEESQEREELNEADYLASRAQIVASDEQINLLKTAHAQLGIEVEYLKSELLDKHEVLATLSMQLADGRDREELLEANLEVRSAQITDAEELIKQLESSGYQATEEIRALKVMLGEQERRLKAFSEDEALLVALLKGDESCLKRVNGQTVQADSLVYQVNETLEKSKLAVAESNHSAHLIEAQRDAALSHVEELAAQVEELSSRLQETIGSAHHWWTHAQTHETRVKEILGSTSWRLTMSLRGVRKGASILLKAPIVLTKAILKPALKPFIGVVLARPGLRGRLNAKLKRYPRLHAHLKKFSVRQGILPQAPGVFLVTSNPTSTAPDFSDLSIFLAAERSTVSNRSDGVRHVEDRESCAQESHSNERVQPQNFYLPEGNARRDTKGPLESWFFK
ncbi:methyltransferase domain-containing protein [Pseudomonas sp. YeP6b]|nr:methyltransferase domain-containing protein [Pseudomonas sp. YeP6b]